MAEKTYLKCSAKARTTTHGEMINIGVKSTDLIAFAQAHTNERGYVNLTVSQRKEPGKYGDTHSVALDTFEPKARGAGVTYGAYPSASAPDDSDVPF